MDDIAWRTWRQITTLHSSEDYERISPSKQQADRLNETSRVNALVKEKQQISKEISDLQREIHQLQVYLSGLSEGFTIEKSLTDRTASGVALTNESAELAQAIRAIRTLTSAERIHALREEFQRFERDRREAAKRYCLIRGKIKAAADASRSMEEEREREVCEMKDAVAKAVEDHQNLKKVMRGEGAADVQVGVDDTTEVAELIGRVEAVKEELEQRKNELENLKEKNAKEKKERKVWREREPVVFEKPERGADQTGADVYEVRKKVQKKRFVRATSQRLLERKKVPPRPPPPSITKFYHPVPESMANYLIPGTVKHAKEL
jgi:hypothetical protein